MYYLKKGYQIILIVIALFSGFLAVFYDLITSDNELLSVLFCFLGFVFSSFLAEVVHELGHLIFGAIFGMKVEIFQVGCFRYSFSEKNLYIVKPTVFGMYSMSGKKPDHMEIRYFFTTFGGLFFSLCYLILCAVALPMEGVFHYLFAFGFPFAFYLFFHNAMPYTTETGRTDGKNLVCRKDPASQTMIRILEITALLRQKSPEEIGESYFEFPVLCETDPLFLTSLKLRYLYYLDTKRLDELVKIDERLQSLVEYLDDFELEEVYNILLYDCCKITKNEEGARALFERQEQYLLSMGTLTAYRILAAYHEVYGSPTILKEYLERAMLIKDEDVGILKMELKLLKEIV